MKWIFAVDATRGRVMEESIVNDVVWGAYFDQKMGLDFELCDRGDT